ncbi:MAG: Na/Pi cotransporter family protein [Victivallales bacterium]|nr:Na/Pi cotransporter family protein [Victivallales bacterium]
MEALKVVQGDRQCALPKSECDKELIVEISYRSRGLFGGKGSTHPVAGVPVRFELLPGSDLKIVCDRPISDNGGVVRARIITGSLIGDQYFKVYPEGFPEVSEVIRVTSGVYIDGNRQEAFSGNALPEPIVLTVYGADGKPVSGVPVYFRLTPESEKKKTISCKPMRILTDAEGKAQTFCKVGSGTGAYSIIAEVSEPAMGIQARGIEIKVFGLNVWGIKGILITVLGGLAIFIYGMHLMTDGLQMVAGNKMRNLLQFFTRNRVFAVLAGTLVTGVIQSSSACTVMVVGFVNAGLLTLTQAIGVVFGANIGTTVTAQIISFKIEQVALPCIAIGLLALLVSSRHVWKGWGSTVMGFGLLFFGLAIMSDELKLVSDFPSVVDFFARFDCSPLNPGCYMPFLSVLGAMAIGMFMTFIIQSSSATIGIALALASSGLINFYTAVPLIIGDNIGTTITANLAALGANRSAKQAAFAHFLFNALGAGYMFVFFFVFFDGYPIYLYFIDIITPGNVFAGENVTRHIAMAHTAFNLFNVLLFLPFIGYIAKLSNLAIPLKPGEQEKIIHLEPTLIRTPYIAIEQVIGSLRYMTREAWQMISLAMEKSFLPRKVDDKLSSSLMKRENKIDSLQSEITAYLVKLTEVQLLEEQAGIVPLLMHCTNDAERIADHAENIISLAKRLKECKKKFSKDAEAEIDLMWGVLKRQAEHVIKSFERADISMADKAKKDERKLDKLAVKFEENHISRLRGGKCNAVTGVIFLEMLAELEKIGDRFDNIADRLPDILKHHLNLGVSHRNGGANGEKS